MRNGITNIVQRRSKITLEIQLNGKDTIEIIHDIVVDDQGNQILESVFKKEDRKWQDSE
jgi:hypothetical protein